MTPFFLVLKEGKCVAKSLFLHESARAFFHEDPLSFIRDRSTIDCGTIELDH